ncbi:MULTISPECIES: VOC family protein [unclassified Rhizobium]|uniref:VOC family protein n=1 Tax=unclassified Rhizobium TaxID=2613769 RepID=UPI00071514A3|nr:MULTISPECIES: VOC family protein [unclassified Rhizobium]KQS96789.1 glyoxalase [Rhizobium sp. Leaf386]KQT06704.1 glyoxalase [Rhizobium sp. Leaf391]KQU10283.1 glyoxalase [Rhizobium sp. Leaf453]
MTEQAENHAIRMPAYVDHSHLVVRDLPMVSAWYQAIMGLSPIEKTASGETLGVAGRPLLTLTTEGNAAIAPHNAPGLFHTAFLVPDRTELGRWLAHIAHNNVPLQGASDHLVSEAIYLGDPEGNGIEVYRDRPREEWNYLQDGMVKMATLPLDLQAIYDEAPKDKWNGMADGTAIGHIHLQVSDIPEANAFFRDVLGLDLMATYPGASFFASGKYHHHIGANIWNSRGAPKRQSNMTGLANYTVRFNDPAKLQAALAALEKLEIPVTRNGDSHSLIDPWGIGLKLEA